MLSVLVVDELVKEKLLGRIDSITYYEGFFLLLLLYVGPTLLPLIKKSFKDSLQYLP